MYYDTNVYYTLYKEYLLLGGYHTSGPRGHKSRSGSDRLGAWRAHRRALRRCLVSLLQDYFPDAAVCGYEHTDPALEAVKADMEGAAKPPQPTPCGQY